MSLDIWSWIALAIAAIGGAAMFATRWMPAASEWARAAIIGAVAIALSGAALNGGGALAIWFSGFFVCAALHRLIEAATRHRPEQ